MIHTKKIEIGGKTYTLTANRKIVKTLAEVVPELLSLNQENLDKMETSAQNNLGVNILANLDILFYDMIKIAHSNIDKAKSDEILDKFEEEYEDVQEKLVELAMSVFQSGDQTNKKKINW